MKMTFEDLVTDIFFLSFFFFVVVFLFSTCDFFFVFAFLLCNIERVGLDLAGGG